MNQTLNFFQGWNLFSINVIPSNLDLMDLLQPLIDSEDLIKVQDQYGNSIEDFGVLGGWTNNIGNIILTQGYKIKVNNDCSIEITGSQVTFPFEIPLLSGWTIMSMPLDVERDGLNIVQQLIDRNTLVKVQDKYGNAIEDFGFLGGWLNFIGNFKPGDGYKIKVTNNETLTINL